VILKDEKNTKELKRSRSKPITLYLAYIYGLINHREAKFLINNFPYENDRNTAFDVIVLPGFILGRRDLWNYKGG
jgi:hypothetical protein